MSESRLPAIPTVLPDPMLATVPALHEVCHRITEWQANESDIDRLIEAQHWLLAVETYLDQKQSAGPAQTAGRLVEARLGDLLGPAVQGRPVANLRRDVSSLTHHERYDFRQLHDHRSLWEPRLPLSRRRALRLIRDDQADARPIHERPADLSSDLRVGDFRDVLGDVPDGSVDLILTDPPYPAEYLPLWSDLAKHAARLLAPSGMLAAMSGQTHLPEVMTRLGEHLPYRWIMAYLIPGAATVVHARRVSTQWKPVLVYGSSERRLHDVATSKMADKDFHGWGQSESGMYALLSLLADPGATVIDPFLGGGTTAVVAQAHGCHFVGCDIDEAAVIRARSRR